MQSTASVQVAEILDKLNAHSTRIDGIVLTPNPQSMREFVELRRDIADLHFKLGRAVEAALQTLHSDVHDETSLKFRNVMRDLRTALVDLQASWPLPAIVEDVAGYRSAKQQFNVVQTACLAAIRGSFLTTISRP